MVEHLTLFDTHAEYLGSKSGLTLPNVSSCLNDYAGHFNPLPYDYEVDYLEFNTNGTFRINTGVRMKRGGGFGCEISDLVVTKSTSGWVFLIGTGFSTKRAQFYVNPSYGHCGLDWQNSNGGNMFIATGSGKKKIECRKKDASNIGIYLDGVQKATKTYFDFADDSTSDISFIGGGNSTYSGKLYSIFIYGPDDTIIFDAIPVVKDGVGYMYDKVSHQLFGNSGTGVFAFGARKDEPLFDAEIEYLQPSSSGTNGAYINTEIKPTDLTGVEIKVRCPADGTNNSKETIFFGASDDTLYKNGNNFTIEKAGGGNIGAFMFKTSSTGTSTIHSGHYSNPYILRVNCSSDGTKKGIMYDENRTQLNNVTLTRSANLPTSLDLYVFCRNINGSPDRSYNYITRIYYLKIWQDKTLVRDMVPVRKGNVGYMYDKVSNRLFGNLGTGDFVLGPDKPFDYRTIYYGII